jgi:hypothetical protein
MSVVDEIFTRCNKRCAGAHFAERVSTTKNAPRAGYFAPLLSSPAGTGTSESIPAAPRR